MDPIFIIGTERSGTNLLRLILDSHSKITIPHPPHIMKLFFGLEPLYGDLGRDRNFRRLIGDVTGMVHRHPYPWGIVLDREEIFRKAGERDLLHVYYQIYEQYRESRNKSRWGCKSTFMMRHVARIRQFWPSAKFIYMVRDCRDVVVSARESIFCHYNAYYTARLWKDEQQVGRYWLQKLSDREIFLLRYEDLLESPEASVKALCVFLEEPYEEGMLRYFERSEAKKCSRLSKSWKNTARPIMKDNVLKFLKRLRPGEIELVEALAGMELDLFGYELTRPLHLLEGKGKFKPSYYLDELSLMLVAQAKHLLHDQNISARLRKFWFMKYVTCLRRLQSMFGLNR